MMKQPSKKAVWDALIKDYAEYGCELMPWHKGLTYEALDAAIYELGNLVGAKVLSQSNYNTKMNASDADLDTGHNCG